MSFVKKISQSNFIKNVLTVASGTAINQVLSILVSPVITRIYGPESFGSYGVFTSMLSIILPIVALTYEQSIVLPSKDENARDLGVLSFYITLFTCLIVLLVVLFGGNRVEYYLNIDISGSFLLLIPVVMFIASLIQISRQWFIRKNEFKLITRLGIINSLFMNFTKVVIGFFIPTASSLIFVFIISQGLYALLLVFGMGSISLLTKRLFKKNSNVISLAHKYREFPLYRGPQSIINSVSSNLPILLLTTLFGPATAGFYTMANRVLRVPVAFLGDSVGSVFYPRFSQAVNNKEKIAKMLINATFSLIIVGVLPFIILIVWAPDIFRLIFGSEWVVSGVYTRWLAIWVFTSLINMPAVKSLPVLNSQKFHLIHTIVTILLKVIALWIGGIVFENDIFAITLYSIVGAVLNIYLILYAIYRARKTEKSYF